MAYSSGYQGYSAYGTNNAQYNQPSYTGYNGAGGEDAGGFLGGSQGGSQGATKSYGKDTLRPVTILQVLEASQPHPDAEFKVDDVELGQITFVGQVRMAAKQATNMTFKLDDGTGTVEVKQWIDPDVATHDEYGNALPNSKAPIQSGNWVRIFGKLKAYNNKRHVGATVIKPVTDMNEISYHLLEATYVHLYFTRGPPHQLAGAAQGNAGNNTGHDAGQQQQQGGDYQNPYPASKTAHLSPGARRVLKCMNETPQTEEGLHMQQIATVTGMNIQDVWTAGQELLDQSIIYGTVDDRTWGLVEPM